MRDNQYWPLRLAAGDCFSILRSVLTLGYINNPGVRKMAEDAVANYDALLTEQDKPEEAAA